MSYHCLTLSHLSHWNQDFNTWTFGEKPQRLTSPSMNVSKRDEFMQQCIVCRNSPNSYTAWINYMNLFALFKVGQQGIAACWQTRDIYASSHSQNSLIKINVWGPSPWEQQGTITPGGLCSVTFSHSFTFNWQRSWKKRNLILMSWSITVTCGNWDF